MENKKINRRTFLKYLCLSLGGLLISPMLKFFQKNNKSDQINHHQKEARYYSSADHLAG